jgi:hypothetical protein
MAEGLSFRAAGRRVGCSHRAIAKAVQAGRITQHADGSLPPDGVDAWNRCRRTPRGGAHRAKVCAPDIGGRIPNAAPAAPIGAGVPEFILDLSTAIVCGAIDLAALVLRHLPAPLARDIIAEWLKAEREAWAGGGGLEPVSSVDEWPAPPGGGAWHDHPLFTEAPSESDWRSAAATASAWRAERGLPPL